MQQNGRDEKLFKHSKIHYRFKSGTVINSCLHFCLKTSFVKFNQLFSILFEMVFIRFGKKLNPQRNLFDEVNRALEDLLLWGVFFCNISKSCSGLPVVIKSYREIASS